MVEGIDLCSFAIHNPAWDADHCAIGRHITEDDGTGPNPNVGANRNIAQHLGSGANYNVIPQGGVALAGFFAGSAKGDALVNQAVVSEDGGFANHNAHAVVNKKGFAEGGTWMDFYPSDEARKMGNKPGDDRYVEVMQLVRDAMQHNCMEAGVKQEDFQRISCRWILFKNNVEVSFECFEHQKLLRGSSQSERDCALHFLRDKSRLKIIVAFLGPDG
jgi:hypothetical protein